MFCFHFCVKQPEVDMLGPLRDRCVSEFVLHWTVLMKDFSVFCLICNIYMYNIRQYTITMYVQSVLHKFGCITPKTRTRHMDQYTNVTYSSNVQLYICYNLLQGAKTQNMSFSRKENDTGVSVWLFWQVCTPNRIKKCPR